MAIRYAVGLQTLNIDMEQNELQNAVIQNFTTATRPTSPVIGQIIFNTTTNHGMVHNGFQEEELKEPLVQQDYKESKVLWV